MSNDLPNPFATLNKKQFRNAEDTNTKKKSAKAKNKTSQQPKQATPQDDDADFMQAMGGVAPINAKGKTAKGGRPQHVAAKDPADTPSLDEMEEFSKVKKLKKNKHSSKIKPSQEESSARDRSREAVANAPVKQEKGEDDAFFAAMQGVQGLSTKGGRDVTPEAPKTKGSPTEDPAKALQDLLDGTVEFTLEYTEEYIQGHVAGLDPIIMGKLRAGQYSPEGHLDMHGMIATEAYDALVEFMRTAYNKGKRTVLVIPGRGKNSPEGFSVLREKVQHWLTHDPFKRVVLAFSTAQPKDGGAGALYVLLRKHKKSRGKIHWERMPPDQDLFA